MALLKFQRNISGVNQQTCVLLSSNPATATIWDDCSSRESGTWTTSVSRGASTESRAQSKSIAAQNSKIIENQKGYERLKSKLNNMKFPSVQVNVPIKMTKMNKYLTGAFSRKFIASRFNTTAGINKNNNNGNRYKGKRSEEPLEDDVSAYSLEKTITKMNESVLSYYDSTYVDTNLQEVQVKAATVASVAVSDVAVPEPEYLDEDVAVVPEYLDDDMANAPSHCPRVSASTSKVHSYTIDEGQTETETKADKERKAKERRAEKISRLSLESRTKALVHGLQSAISLMSRLTRLEELCEHLIANPECVYEASKEEVVPLLQDLSESPDKNVRGMAYQCMSLMGHTLPLNSPGIRILSIDGGGTRGVVAIEFLKALERETGKRIHEMFDYVCGVSTGALLAAMICLYKVPLDQCEYLYKKSSVKTFTRNRVVGTTRLVWNHGFYDSKTWEDILRKEMGNTPFIEFSRDPTIPKMSAVSAKVSSKGMTNYLFRNYNLPPGMKSQYPGHCKHKLWEVIRASSAAPGYFEPFHLGGEVHEDGGILSNNPTALAIHESRLLWEKERLHCIVSLGTGRHETKLGMRKLSLKRKLATIVDSACDTEAVHYTIQDLLPSNVYYRFNPYLSEEFFLDEIRPDKIEQMQKDARLYNRRNSSKVMAVSERLLEMRKPQQRITDWMKSKLG